MSLITVLQRLQAHQELCSLTFEDICQYARLVRHLQDDILLPQPSELTTTSQAPEILPRAIGLFLSDALKIPQKYMQESWDILKGYVWGCKKVALTREDYDLFKVHGWKLGLTALTIYPPEDQMKCTNVDCENYEGEPLKKEKTRSVLVFTHANGVQPATAVHVTCPR